MILCVGRFCIITNLKWSILQNNDNIKLLIAVKSYKSFFISLPDNTLFFVNLIENDKHTCFD